MVLLADNIRQVFDRRDPGGNLGVDRHRDDQGTCRPSGCGTTPAGPVREVRQLDAAFWTVKFVVGVLFTLRASASVPCADRQQEGLPLTLQACCWWR